MTDDILPGLMGNWTDEELNEHTIRHAKYFTVVQIQPGGFVAGGSNYIREQVDTLEGARIRAAELYAIRAKAILIYAVADFAGANGFSRPVENFPPITYQTKSDKARSEKLARQKAREARLNMGNKPAKPAKVSQAAPAVAEVLDPYDADFMDASEPMVMITLDD